MNLQESLQLPLWMVSSRHADSPAIDGDGVEASRTLAFTSAEKMHRFLERRRMSEWNKTLVADEAGLLMAMADLHSDGFMIVSLDPRPDGSDGTPISLEHILRRIRRN